jgi:integrase
MGVRIRDGQWHYRFNFRGREFSGPTGIAGESSNRTAAEQFAKDQRAALENRKAQPVAVQRVAVMPGFIDAATEFLDWCKDTQYRARPSTAQRIAVSFVSLKEFFGSSQVRSITNADVERYKTHRANVHQVRDITIRHDLHALSVFFRYGRKRGWLKGDPMLDVSIPSDRDAIREHVITEEEERKYFAAVGLLNAKYRKSFKDAQPNLADLARLLLEQGARPEEILSIRKEHYDAAEGTLLIPGGKSRAARRTLYLTDVSNAILDRRMKLRGPWLFPSDRNPGHHLTQLGTAHDRACIEAGVSFVLYDLRHTFATRKVQENVPVPVVAAILGHSGLRTISRYVHPTAEAQKAAMQSDRKVG